MDDITICFLAKNIAVEQTEFLTKIENSILPVLERMRIHNANHADMSHSNIYTLDWQEYHRFANISMTSIKQYIGKPESEISGMIVALNNVVNAVKNKVLTNTVFPYEITMWQTGYYRLDLAKMIDAKTCDLCSGLYTRSGMSSHVGSLRCMRDSQCIDVQKLGYEILDDSEGVSAVRKAKIEFAVRPSGLDMWVPSWVAQAIRNYKKNKNFAGLKLHEYLRAVSNDG